MNLIKPDDLIKSLIGNPKRISERVLADTNNHCIMIPKYMWKIELLPQDGGLSINATKAPNWFWRKMQYFLLGWRWKRL